jgi:hypothetical protein
MTPTEQDKELEKLDIRSRLKGLSIFKLGFGFDTHELIDFITADRKRVALEARLDEIKRLHPRIMQSGIGVEHIAINADLRNRIAELKDQQEQL